MKICVFCNHITREKEDVCPNCHDYKGLEKFLKEDPRIEELLASGNHVVVQLNVVHKGKKIRGYELELFAASPKWTSLAYRYGEEPNCIFLSASSKT